MDERRTEGFTDPLAGPDGTGPTRRGEDPTTTTSPASDVRLPGPTGPDGVARWMDADRERALRPLAREASPPRAIPPQRPERVLPPEFAERPPTADEDPEESAWQRERREEAEFRAQFGEWRAGAPGRRATGSAAMGPRAGGGLLGGVRLGAPLIVLIAVLVAVFALALHL